MGGFVSVGSVEKGDGCPKVVLGEHTVSIEGEAGQARHEGGRGRGGGRGGSGAVAKRGREGMNKGWEGNSARKISAQRGRMT